MKNILTILGIWFIAASAAFGQVSLSKWEYNSRLSGIPTTFTNTQASARNQTTYRPIALNSSTSAPITFLASGISTGPGNTASQFTVTFGSSIDGVNYFTNGTWVFNITTNAAQTRMYASTNFTHGAKWPYIHVLSVSMATNTTTGFMLQYVQPNQ